MNIQSIGASPPTSPRTTEIAAGSRQTTEAGAKSDVQGAANKETARPASTEQLKAAVDQANDFIKPFNGSLQFQIDKDTGITVVKVLDVDTKEVIKQIPSEDMLNLAKALNQLKGLLVKQQA